MRKPAHRGATAGLSNASWQVSTERYAPDSAPRQAQYISTRFGVSPLHAALIAELAFPTLDEARGRA